jgi:hypothetical protein
MSDTPLDEQYLTWLYARIGDVSEKRPSKTYWSLLRLLYCREFVWLIPNDDNRVEDGRDLRYEFLDEAGLSGDVDPNWMGLGCSVLELIFGVAKRLVFEADGDFQHWVWELLTNLGLSGYTDRGFNERQVEDIVDRFIWRTYEPDGRGGLFPMPGVDEDQRNVEIFYQLCQYILERS